MQEIKRNACLILSNIAWGMIDNAADAFLGGAPCYGGLVHKQLTRPMFLSTERADLNRVGPLLQPLARPSRLLGFLGRCLKTKQQEKGPQGITANRKLRRDSHGKYRLLVGRIKHAWKPYVDIEGVCEDLMPRDVETPQQPSD